MFWFSYCRKKENYENGRFALEQAKKKRINLSPNFDKFLWRVVYTSKLQMWQIFFAIKKLGRQLFNKCIWHIKFAKKSLISTSKISLTQKLYQKKFARVDPALRAFSLVKVYCQMYANILKTKRDPTTFQVAIKAKIKRAKCMSSFWVTMTSTTIFITESWYVRAPRLQTWYYI